MSNAESSANQHWLNLNLALISSRLKIGSFGFGCFIHEEAQDRDNILSKPTSNLKCYRVRLANHYATFSFVNVGRAAIQLNRIGDILFL